MPADSPRRGVIAASLLTMVVVLGACSGDGAASICLGEPEEQVCLERTDRGVSVRATGLEPGSEIEIDTGADTDPQVIPVGLDGNLDAIEVLGIGDERTEFEIRAVGVSGDRIESTVGF